MTSKRAELQWATSTRQNSKPIVALRGQRPVEVAGERNLLSSRKITTMTIRSELRTSKSSVTRKGVDGLGLAHESRVAGEGRSNAIKEELMINEWCTFMFINNGKEKQTE